MNWSDVGIVLSSRKYGETSVIVSLMTPGHGRHLGLVRGGAGKRARGIYQAGNLVSVDWSARIEEQLGTFRCELLKPLAALYLDDPLRLAGLSSACAVAERALPEREDYMDVYESLYDFLVKLDVENWLENYVRWEISLLTSLGFGLNLSSCASTGQTFDLIYVSPKSGHAISAIAGKPYKNKLLGLPDFLISDKYRCKSAAITEIKQEFLKRIYMPIYIPLLGLICSFLILISKNDFNYSKKRLSIFIYATIILIFSEISLRYATKMSYYIILLIPIFLFFLNYIIIII